MSLILKILGYCVFIFLLVPFTALLLPSDISIIYMFDHLKSSHRLWILSSLIFSFILFFFSLCLCLVISSVKISDIFLTSLIFFFLLAISSLLLRSSNKFFISVIVHLIYINFFYLIHSYIGTFKTY